MRIGIYLGSFKPMHVGHEQTLTQAAQLNDVLLFFPGFGAKGVKRGKRKNPSSGEKEDYYRPMDDQAMMTDDLGEKQFRLIKQAVEQIKKDNPSSPSHHHRHRHYHHHHHRHYHRHYHHRHHHHHQQHHHHHQHYHHHHIIITIIIHRGVNVCWIMWARVGGSGPES